MELSYRLDKALSKLYLAFHENRLDPENCYHCAVGNICDNKDFWKHFTNKHGSTELSYVGFINQEFGKKYYGYSPKELVEIEAVFLKGCGYTLLKNKHLLKPSKKVEKEAMFEGLCAAVKFMCHLEGIKNVMEMYTKFNFDAIRQVQDVS